MDHIKMVISTLAPLTAGSARAAEPGSARAVKRWHLERARYDWLICTTFAGGKPLKCVLLAAE
jgi:hypothetical protein